MTISAILELALYSNSETELEMLKTKEYAPESKNNFNIHFSEVRGQKIAKRAIEVPACCGDNVIMFYHNWSG